MEPNIFNVNLARWDVILLLLIPSVINIGLYLYVSFAFNKTRLNLFFSIFLLLIGIWQTTEGFMRMSDTIEAAAKWYEISSIFILLIIPFGIRFVLRLLEWDEKINSSLLSIILFLPVIIFFILIEGGYEKYEIIPSHDWHWIGNPEPTLVTSLIFCWTGAGGLLIVVFLWMYYFKERKHNLKRDQALWLALGLTLPIILGIIVEIIFPLLLQKNDIPVTTTLITLFSVSAVIAINKFKMFDYSPKHQWERIVGSLNDAILIVNNADEIMYANESFCKSLGYEFNEIKGEKAFDLFLTEENKIRIKEIIAKKKKKKASRYELQLKKKNGEKIWMLISGSPYFSSKGEVIGSIGVQTNITHLKEAKITLEKSELRLNQAQAVAHVGSWEFNFGIQKAIWSDEACRIYGLSLDLKNDQSFESWLEFIHPEDIDFVKREIERSNSTLTDASFTHRIIRTDGVTRHIHSIAKIEFNKYGQPIGVFGICHDITEQKEAEKTIMEKEKRISSFIDESLLAIYFVNPVTKKVTYANPAFLQLLGYTLEELKELEVYSFIDHEKQNVDEHMAEVIKNKKISNGERIWKSKDGRIINVLVSSVHQHTDIDTIYVAAQDITARKKAEENLEITNKELETFIYKASHDLRTPLASMLGLVNVSKIEIKDKVSINYINMIGNSAKKLDYTLLGLVKAMSIKDTKIFTDEIDFTDLIHEILNGFEHYKGFSDLKVDINVLFPNLFLSNKIVMETIIQNLIENAIKYRKRSAEGSFLKIAVSEDSKNVKIVLEDNGIGIEESAKNHVFEMYYRGTDAATGSGLGLYLVKKAVDKLQGKIFLKSKFGCGTTFEVILPQILS